ncbi:PREDICTED: glycine-rich, partial [Prunus dulcis]
EIIELKIINDRETERSRGFIFVTFNNEKAIRDAIEGISGQNLDGRNITVNEALSRGSGVVVAVTKVTAMKDMAVLATEEAVIVKAVGIASR